MPMDQAMHPDEVIASAMNGEALPHNNGFQLRIVVPGWTATYWMKHVNQHRDEQQRRTTISG